MTLLDRIEIAFLLGCVVLVAILFSYAAWASVEIRDLRKSEREAWEAYHELRATQGAMELF